MYEEHKRNAARKALELVKDGMVIGLGSGSTLIVFTQILGQSSLNVKVVVSSEQIKKVAEESGLGIIEFDNAGKIDLAIDGADQIDKGKNLLKGLGAFAIVGEKKLDYAAEKCIIIADERKVSEVLDMNVLLEVEKERKHAVITELADFNCSIVKETEHEGNGILFLDFGVIKNAAELELRLEKIEGVKGTGIFANFKTPIEVVVGYADRAELI